jgi:hypothetical protein
MTLGGISRFDQVLLRETICLVLPNVIADGKQGSIKFSPWVLWEFGFGFCDCVLHRLTKPSLEDISHSGAIECRPSLCDRYRKRSKQLDGLGDRATPPPLSEVRQNINAVP